MMGSVNAPARGLAVVTNGVAAALTPRRRRRGQAEGRLTGPIERWTPRLERPSRPTNQTNAGRPVPDRKEKTTCPTRSI